MKRKYQENKTMQLLGQQYLLDEVAKRRPEIKEIFEAHGGADSSSGYWMALDFFMFGLIEGKRAERARRHKHSKHIEHSKHNKE